jgi:hypothetical protein
MSAPPPDAAAPQGGELVYTTTVRRRPLAAASPESGDLGRTSTRRRRLITGGAAATLVATDAARRLERAGSHARDLELAFHLDESTAVKGAKEYLEKQGVRPELPPVQACRNTTDGRRWSFLFDAQDSSGRWRQEWVQLEYEPKVDADDDCEVVWEAVRRAEEGVHVNDVHVESTVAKPAAAALAKEWFDHESELAGEYAMVLPPKTMFRDRHDPNTWSITFDTEPHSHCEAFLKFSCELRDMSWSHEGMQWVVRVAPEDAEMMHRFSEMDERSVLRANRKVAPPPSVLEEAERAADLERERGVARSKLEGGTAAAGPAGGALGGLSARLGRHPHARWVAELARLPEDQRRRIERRAQKRHDEVLRAWGRQQAAADHMLASERVQRQIENYGNPARAAGAQGASKQQQRASKQLPPPPPFAASTSKQRLRVRELLQATAFQHKREGDIALKSDDLDGAVAAYTKGLTVPDQDVAMLSREPWVTMLEQLQKVEKKLAATTTPKQTVRSPRRAGHRAGAGAAGGGGNGWGGAEPEPELEGLSDVLGGSSPRSPRAGHVLTVAGEGKGWRDRPRPEKRLRALHDYRPGHVWSGEQLDSAPWQRFKRAASRGGHRLDAHEVRLGSPAYLSSPHWSQSQRRAGRRAVTHSARCWWCADGLRALRARARA